MRPKSILLLVLALGCGLVASIGVTQLKSDQQVVTVQGETVDIYVAMQDILMGNVIKPEMVKLTPWPKDKLPKDAVMKLEDLKDRRPRSIINEGDVIRESKLLSPGQIDDVLGKIPKGYEAMTVKVDDVSSMSGLLKPGDWVNVVVHVNANPTAGIPSAMTIRPKDLQRVQVFAMGTITERDRNGQDTVTVGKTVSLLLTPPQAQLMTFASEIGQIRLLGRNAEENSSGDKGDRETIDFDTLLHGIGGAVKSSHPLLSSKVTPPPTLIEAPVEPKVEATASEKPKLTYTMIIVEGTTTREVEFDEHGKIIPKEVPAAAGAVIPAGDIPAAAPAVEPPVSIKDRDS